MIFLSSAAGMSDKLLLTPSKWMTPATQKASVWAADNEAYSRGFDPDRFFPWLKRMEPYRDTCLFVAVPDVVGDAAATVRLYKEWLPHFDEWPTAFVAQDGQEDLDLPDNYDCLFVGGTTGWKVSDVAMSVIKRAQADGKHIHIGRVNWWKRYKHFRLAAGSESWTCDGNRAKFDGRDNTRRAWHGYMAQPPLFQL